MANNPITTPLPADLPANWTYGQTIGASGTDVGLTPQHGYNYLMQQVNAAQQAAKQIGQAFSGLPSLGSDGKIPAAQLPNMNYDPAGSAAAVQTNLTNHINNKSNPHGVTASQITAGILAVANGGTGTNSIEGIAAKLFPSKKYDMPSTSYNFAILGPGWADNGHLDFPTLVSLLSGQGMAEVHMFSYMGTGTYEGDINAGGVSVTADKPILMVGVLMRKENSTGEFYPTTSTRSSDNNANTIILTSPLTTEYTEGTGLGDPYGSTTNAKLYAKKSVDGKTVYWTCRYSTSYYGGRYGFAEEGYTYYGFYIC